MKQHIMLKVGQTRLKGDEVRHKDGGGKNGVYGGISTNPWIVGPWENVMLIGHPILQSDLIIAEFRREVAVD